MNFRKCPGSRAVLGILCLSAVMVMMATGCVKKPDDVLIESQPKQTVESELDQKIVQLVTESYIPYAFEENRVIKGLAVDVVTEAFRRQGYTVDLQILPWTRALQMVQDGDTDGIFCAFYSEDRAVYMQYLKEPIADEAQFVYTLKDSPVKFDGTIDSLKPYRIGMVQDYFFGAEFDSVRKSGELKVEAVTDLPSDIQKLLEGRIDAMVDHHLSTLYYLKKMGVQDKVIEQATPLRKPEGLYLCFSKSRNIDQDLVRRIDEELVKMKSDGSYQKIIDHYTQ